MGKLLDMQSWATFFISLVLLVFFTFSVGFLASGFLVLPLFSAVLILIGTFCELHYETKKEKVEAKILAILNISLLLGFLPGIGMRYMGAGLIGPYFWLSLVTMNLAYSIGLIIYHDITLFER